MLADLSLAGVIALLAIIGVMATGMSLFQDFPWDALSTLLAGVAAVLAAVYVGKRQMEISRGQNTILDRQADIAHRQADILAKQVELESLKLRSDLFDRRFKVFEATEAYLFAAYNSEGLVGNPATRAFKKAREQAQFLFDDRVCEALNQMHNHGWQYEALQKFVETRNEQGHGDPVNDLNAVMDAQSQIGRDMSSLAKVFGRHLTISDVPFVDDEMPTDIPNDRAKREPAI